ncbi:MAG: hypothetical protein IKO25_09525 [Clostridia bacterium]|nr:hypothetical protein [Clostridia bacterium]
MKTKRAGNPDVYRVSTDCLAENIGSERVMQKNGVFDQACQSEDNDR